MKTHKVYRGSVSGRIVGYEIVLA